MANGGALNGGRPGECPRPSPGVDTFCGLTSQEDRPHALVTTCDSRMATSRVLLPCRVCICGAAGGKWRNGHTRMAPGNLRVPHELLSGKASTLLVTAPTWAACPWQWSMKADAVGHELTTWQPRQHSTERQRRSGGKRLGRLPFLMAPHGHLLGSGEPMAPPADLTASGEARPDGQC